MFSLLFVFGTAEINNFGVQVTCMVNLLRINPMMTTDFEEKKNIII